MSDAVASITPASVLPATPAGGSPNLATTSPSSGGFHEFLSELNPLQYIPVVGTIYRAVTGDTIPDTAREVGSFVASGLMGGPVGLATNALSLGIEKLTGISPEQIGQSVLASLGIGHAAATQVASTTQAASTANAPAPAAEPAPASPVVTPASASDPFTGWTQARLAAYGITRIADGSLTHGKLVGSDVLNDLVLNGQAVSDAVYAAGTPASAEG